MRAMRVCVFGAGAVGGNIAVMLARAGADVSVLVRGATLQAVRARGLELHTPDGVVRANVRASDDPRELGEQDAVLVTVKQTALTASAPASAAPAPNKSAALGASSSSGAGNQAQSNAGRRAKRSLVHGCTSSYAPPVPWTLPGATTCPPSAFTSMLRTLSLPSAPRTDIRARLPTADSPAGRL